jgi:spore maturation protein CgeB
MRSLLPEQQENIDAISKMATEGVLAEATYHHADLVLIISGMHFHEVGLWLLTRYQIPTAVILTESPYQDAEQAQWLARYPGVAVFTHERTSAERYGWTYLPHAYDPEIHRPVEPDLDEVCDVLFCGTGFPERQQLLEGIDWTGINLRLRGLWPTMTEQSPLFPHLIQGCVKNGELPRAYAAAKIALNLHRAGNRAVSLNPRAYELAACGTFQIGDGRREQIDLFGPSVPTAHTSAEFEQAIRYYLAHEDERRACAADAHRRVEGQTFDARVMELMAELESRTIRAAAG